MMKMKQEALSFNGLGIAPRLLEILSDLSFDTPTPIQLQSIPISLEGKDLVGIAQTGTGKTLAFGIPMLQLLANNKGMGLVVLPTRELASQVDESLKTIGKMIGLRTAVLIGGEPIGKQLNDLRRKPHIIVATPGRLVDHAKRGSVSLGNVKVLVLDEADMMLDMGFLPQIKEILDLVPKERQTMLFSATMPNQIMKIASDHMALPIRVEVAPAGTAAESVEQEIIITDRAGKFDQLNKILSETKGSVLIFARTKHGVKNLTRKVNDFGFRAAEIHSNRSLPQRREALNGFKLGKYRVLVATDIAARGIDVKGIELVINYDLPENPEDYVHRIGRTGRAGESGKAISFALPNQLKDIKDIEKLTHQILNVTKTAFDQKAFDEQESVRAASGRGQRSRYSGVSSGTKTQKSFQGKRRSFGGSSSFKPRTQSRSNAPQRVMSDRERFRRSMM
jgi:ATP-dependent RNA helicase RhlE